MDFTEKLPFDILSMIFSHSMMWDDDSIEFRKVSKRWRAMVPEWSQARFTGIHFDGDERAPFDQLYPFLGRHTRNVSFATLPCDTWDDDEDILLDMFQELIDHGCTQIETLWLNYCSFSDHNRFMTQLAILGTKIYDLSFTKHGTNLPFYRVISLCPELSHFSFSASSLNEFNLGEALDGGPGYTGDTFLDDLGSGEDEDEYYPRSVDGDYDDDYGDVMFPNLLCLSIDIIMTFKRRLAPILKRAPNLRVFRTANIDIYEFRYDIERTKGTTNTKRLFEWCPLLMYVEYNDLKPDYYTDVFDNKYWRIDYTRLPSKPDTAQNGCLRHLVYYEPVDNVNDATIEQVIRNQQSLELLKLGSNSQTNVQWDRLGTVARMPYLRRLDIDGIICREQSIASFIRACPAIEALLVNIETNGRGYEPVFPAINTLQNLHDLKINYKSNRFQEAEDDPYPPTHQQLVPACNFFNSLTIPLKSLMVRGGWELVLNYPFLSAVSSVTTLTNLELYPGGGAIVTDEEVVGFMRQLKRTKIEGLTLSCFGNWSLEAFLALGELSHLQSLKMDFCRPVSSPDLIKAIEKSNTLHNVHINGFANPDGPDEIDSYVKEQFGGMTISKSHEEIMVLWEREYRLQK
ncbi:hypothetical protein BJV82DRAFT_624849 [Fennellomyces sp. T-0311]|nr:hypothetical protein BJV82DRAFT_624849 [Fennellomyces sp. T-0311]